MHSGVQLSGRSHSPHSDYYAWEFPGAPARVHLHLGVVADLERQLLWQYQYNPEAQLFGVLLGRVIPHGAIIVDDFERVEGGENGEKLKPVLAKWAEKADPELGVVGYYRSQSRDGFALTQDDLLLIHSQFAQSLSLVMLIKPGATSVATAGFFFALGGEAKSRFSFGRFPFDREQLAAERPALSDLAGATPQTAPAAVPRVPISPLKSLEESIAEDTVPMKASPAAAPETTTRVEVRTKPSPARDLQWIWFATGAALAVLALGVELFQWFGQSPDSAVSLQGTRLSQGLEVSWNQDAKVFNGDGALLFIQEGQARKQYYLDLPKLRKGHLLYYPYSKGEVQLRMEVLLRGGQGSATVDTVVAGFSEAPGDAGWTAPSRLAQNTSAPGDHEFHPFVQPTTGSSAGSAVVLLEPPDPNAVLNLPGSVQKVEVPSATHSVSLPLATQPRETGEAGPANALAPQSQNPSVVKLDAGNTLVEPRVARSVMPVVPADSRVWRGQPVLIDVLVQIDTEGKVVSAVPRSPRTLAGTLLGKLAVDAAQQWTFEPAYVGNKKVASEMFLRFQF
jgi:hypothetical protein